MKKIFTALLFASIAFCANAQSAEKISEIIESEKITYGQASYLACVFSGISEESISYEESLASAVENNWVKDGSESSTEIKIKELCNLYAKAVGIKGGLFYRITKAPRYAFNEFKALGIFDKSADPDMTISGQNAVNVLNACVKSAEGSK